MPLTLFVDPTNYCNFKCSFCPRSFDDYKKFIGKYTHMSLELFKKIAAEISLWGKLKSLKLYYIGEPFLNPEIIEFIKLAIYYDISERIEITSNGSVLNSKIADSLVNAAKSYSGIIYLRFSIYSVNQINHNQLTRSTMSIDRIKENIKYLRVARDIGKAQNIHIYAKMINTYSEDNELFIQSYKNIADETCIEEPMDWNSFENMSLLSKTYKKNELNEIKSKILGNRHACSYPFYSLTINADGSVVCCCVDWNRKTYIGNINKYSLKEIWEGQALRNFQLMHIEGHRSMNESCRNCTILHELPETDNIDSITAEEYKRRIRNIEINNLL